MLVSFHWYNNCTLFETMRTLLLVFTLSTVGILDAQLVYEKNLSADLVAVDSHGNAYVAAVGGVTAGAVTKLSPSGNVIYSYPISIKGTLTGIAVDSSGNVVLTGTTGDDTLPTNTAVFQPKRNSSGACITGDKNASPFPCPDAFVAKLDPSGNLLWASYLGGSVQEQANGVAVDSSGNIVVVGLTQSFDFPTVSPFQPKFGGYVDGFVTKIAPDGSKVLYSSFMGGAGNDIAHAIAVDTAGNAYIAGEGSGIPVTMESFAAVCADTSTHAFLIKLSATGSLVNGSCLGSPFSAATAVTVDSSGAAYIGGSTNTTTFPLTSGAFDGRTGAPYSDFITKVSPDGMMLVYSAQLDGSSFGIYSLSVDASGAVYAAGATGSATCTATGPSLQPCPGPSLLIYNFLLKLNPAGSSLTYFSYEDALQHSVSVVDAADGSVVEAAGPVRNPVARGPAMVLIVTGSGQTLPQSHDGQIAQGTGALGVGVTAQLTNSSTGSPLQLSLPVVYAGPIPGMIAAVQQIRVQIPVDLPSYFTAGTTASQNLSTVLIGTQAIAVPVAIAQ
jgi:hypothetical protein